MGIDEYNFSRLICCIVSMFTLMMTSSKMIDFLNRLSIPFSLYRIVLRTYCNSGKFLFLKKPEAEQCFKFIGKMLSIRSKNFPRLYGALILNIIREYSGGEEKEDLLVSR